MCVCVCVQTFIEWFVEEYFGGPAGMGNADIIGFYIDDDWGNMNPNGPSEMDKNAMVDMGVCVLYNIVFMRSNMLTQTGYACVWCL